VGTTAIRAAITIALDRAALMVDHFAEGIHIHRAGGRSSITLNVSALPPDNPLGTGIKHPHAIAFIVDTVAGLPVDSRLLKTLYSLTPAESRLVMALCSGTTINSYAAKHRVSTGTLRTQLKSAFAKTATNRQIDLVRLILSLSNSKR
jgi:DNA-binding CsgD family transcriptional regulator